MQKSMFPNPTLWPRDRDGVLEVAHQWYDQSLVAVNTTSIANMPQGEVVPPSVGATNFEREVDDMDMSDAAALSIAMNSINYMFWDKVDDEFIRYQRHGVVGALAMTQAFQDAWDEPTSAISQARFTKTPLTLADIESIFGDIPNPQSRVDVLNEVLLSDRLDQLSEEMQYMQQSNHGVFNTSIAARIADAFPLAYGDEVLKKAQLAVSGIWRDARARGFTGDCELTAFADYQIPNVLRALGVLDYSDELAQKIEQGQLIDENSVEERAIRAASILAIEQIAQQQNVSVADVDYWVWLKRKEPQTPFHLTKTLTY